MEFLDGVIFAVIIEGYYTDIDNQQITTVKKLYPQNKYDFVFKHHLNEK